MKRYLLSMVMLLGFNLSSAQVGGTYTYEWMSNPLSARLTALGGSQIALVEDDLSVAGNNPALLSDKTNHLLTVNHNFSFTGIGNGYLGFGFSLDTTVYLHAGINYASYGDFVLSEPDFGNYLGTFSGNETAFVVGAGKKMNERIRLGVNLKAIMGSFETYNSFGLAADLGLHYKNPGSLWDLAFLIKNVGVEIDAYGQERTQAPLDVQIGYSQRLKHLPFRLSILAHDLHRWGLRYDDPNNVGETDLDGNPLGNQSAFSKQLDNVFRHLIFGGEFLIGKNKNLKLRFGYNHQLRKELSVGSYRSLTGFSLGVGIRVKGINIDYGVGNQHIAGATNHLSISMSLGKFLKRS